MPAYTLPDSLVCKDGRAVRDAAGWTGLRRAEVLELFAREVYGRTPGGKPAGMHAELVSLDPSALGGKAVRKQIRLWFTEGFGGPSLDVLIYQPPVSGAGATVRWPAFVGLNFFGNPSVDLDPGIELPKDWLGREKGKEAKPPTRGMHASRWQVETLVARGYATVTAYCGDLCPDRADGLKDSVAAPLFGTGGTEQRGEEEWGAIGVWAWGLSRILDYLESDPEIDAKRVAVHGHSRLGKAALWAGAQDERFALVISNESGCGGAALSMRDFGETVGIINKSFPHWFSRRFRHYGGNELSLPVDQHGLLALIAPRALYVASASEDLWADPRGEFLALKQAEPVYALFGHPGLGVEELPAPDHPLSAGRLGYHLRTGKHDITAYDWAQYLNFADRVMK